MGYGGMTVLTALVSVLEEFSVFKYFKPTRPVLLFNNEDRFARDENQINFSATALRIGNAYGCKHRPIVVFSSSSTQLFEPQFSVIPCLMNFIRWKDNPSFSPKLPTLLESQFIT